MSFKKYHKLLNKKLFCITGTFEKFEKEDLEKKLSELGGTVVDLSEDIDLLIVGKNPGPELQKARELGQIFIWHSSYDVELDLFMEILLKDVIDFVEELGC